MAIDEPTKGYVQRALEGIGSFFSRAPEVVPGADMTEASVKVLGSKGIVDPRTINPKTSFRGVPYDWNNYFTAHVSPTAPNQINLARMGYGLDAIEHPMTPHTLAHELSHSMAYAGGSELDPVKRNRADVFRDNYGLASGADRKMQTREMLRFYERASDPKILEHIRKNYGIRPSYLGNSEIAYRSSPMVYEELAADLTSAMKVGKKDIFEDPFLVKNLFNNNPYLMAAVNSTLHVEPRLDAKDPPRLTLNRGLIEKYKSMLDAERHKQNRDSRNAESIGGTHKRAGGSVDMPDEYSQGRWKLI